MAESYTVKEGDTLSGIAEQFGISDYNTITGYSSGDPNVLSVGEVLTLPDNQLGVSSDAADSEFSTYSSNLTNALATIKPTTPTTAQPEITIENVSQYDPYAKMLDDLAATSNASTQALIASIQASRMNQANSVNAMYDKYKSGLQLLGIQHNTAQSTPDLLMGHIQQAENEQMKKIQDLDFEEKKLIMDAQLAQQQNDLETLKAKMDRVEEIKAEKNQALKDIADRLGYESDIADSLAHTYYDTFVGLDTKDQEAFLIELAKTGSVSVVALTTAFADEQKARVSSSSGSDKVTENEAYSMINELLNSGLLTPTGAPYVDANGYLTPEGFKTISDNAIEDGISRDDIIDQYSGYFYTGNLMAYGLTQKEIDTYFGSGGI